MENEHRSPYDAGIVSAISMSLKRNSAYPLRIIIPDLYVNTNVRINFKSTMYK